MIIGGSIGRTHYDLIRPTLFEELKRYTMRPALKDAELVRARLPGRAAVNGAIALVLTPQTTLRGKRLDPLVDFVERKVGTS